MTFAGSLASDLGMLIVKRAWVWPVTYTGASPWSKSCALKRKRSFRFVVDTAPSNRHDAADQRLNANSKRLRYFSFSRRHLPLAEKLTQN